ncbi:MAG: DNA primase [Candidatus Krumholzibacteria bacterium]|nr:DNA primase [Candidatus Krumholzibacteria bacterium]
MIPQKIIDEIRERTDIVQLIGSYLDLRKAGRNFKALCPFHGEKTPSFMVNPEKQIYHCFGCGKGGNAFHFLMEYEGVGFIEAVERLAKEAGINVDRYAGGGDRKEKLEPYYRAMEYAAKFYERMLAESAEAAGARSYLERREIGAETIEEFSLGFAPASWDALYRSAMESGISRDVLLELNLVMKGRGGSGYRDYFRNRVIFPLESLSNRFVGLAGRVLDDSEPKYLNTAESSIYYKGKMLYGLNHSKDGIRKSGSALIVEGYMDYLMLWKNGFRNVCAVCGTSFTQDQGRLLARYANHVYIINDGDRAGIRASVRAADALLTVGLDSNVVVLPEGEDPDSFVKKKGAEELRGYMRSAPNYFAFLKKEALSGSRTTYRKNQVIKHLLETLSSITDPVRQELYLQEMSTLFDVQAPTLRSGLKQRGKTERPPEKLPEEESLRERHQKLLFRLGLENERCARMILDDLDIGDLEGTLFMDYYKALDSALRNHVDIAGSAFTGAIDDPELSKLASEIALLQLPPGPQEQVLTDTLKWLKKEAVKDELDLMKKRLRALETEKGAQADGERREITNAYRELSRKLRERGPQGGNPD